MPSLDRAAALNAAYATTVAAIAGLCWMGSTYPISNTMLGGALTLPTLDPLGGGTLRGLACTWLPASGLALAISLRLRFSGAAPAASAIPFAFLAVAAAFASVAWAFSPGPVASLLASFSRTTIVLFLGLLSLGAACVPRDEADESAETVAHDAEILRLSRQTQVQAQHQAVEDVALAA